MDASSTPKDLALSYSACGIPVFPCRDREEYTGRFDPESGEEIVYGPKTPLVSDGFKGATLNERVINILWDRNPSAMIGSPTGEQMGAWVLDVDVHKGEDGKVVNGFETLAALEAKYGELPTTATVKTAGGGEHRYFRYVPGTRNRGKFGAGLDVRSSGGYVIMPGSRLAGGKEYVWLDHDGAGLPPLADAPQWLLDLVLPPKEARQDAQAYVHNQTGNSAYVERAIESELSSLAMTPPGGRNNRINDAAFALGQFVGAGALDRSDAEAQLIAIASQWSNLPKSKTTIRRGLDAGEKQPRVIPEPEFPENTWTVDVSRLIENARRKQALEDADEQHADPEEPEIERTERDEDTVTEYKLDAVGDIEQLTYPGGLLEDLINWIASSAEQPSRTLAMAAVLPLVASLIGARYSTTNRDTRANIYTVALAESGFGKEHARSQIKRLLMSDQGVFTDYSGPARIMSASALREVLENHNAVNCQIDEFGGFVRDITDRKAGSHQRAISTDLRDYYSASSTFFEGAAYRGTPPKRIYNPCLCVHGTSTPEQFWTALSSASAEDGLLPRLIMFHVQGQKPKPVKPDHDVRYVPTLLLERMADIAGIDVAKKRGNLSGIVKATPLNENKPYVVPWTPDAEAILRALKESLEEKERMVAPEARPFVRRIIENAIKLALIAAVGLDPKRPAISESIFDWAAGVAWTCAAGMLAEVSERLSDNQREANYKKIAALVRKAGRTGITEGRIADRCKGIDARQRNELLEDLYKTGQVEQAESQKGRKSRRFVWVG